MRKIWDIHGGVHPAENKAQSNQHPIATLALPKEFILPLNQHIGAPAVVAVNIGEHVLKGQRIAEPQGYVSTAIHAPTSGIVSAIESRPINHPSGLEALCVVIEPDGNDTWVDREPVNDWRAKDKSELIERLRYFGIAGMGGAGFPTSVKMSPRANQQIDTLILNGTECEPYITADDVLMREHASEIIFGLEVLSELLSSPETLLIGIEDNKPAAAEAMRNAARESTLNIDVVTFPTKYPSGGEKQLIQILTGKEVPAGKLPADIGIVLQNVGTARAVYRAIRLGEPLIDRVTTIVGESLKIQQNAHVLIGTPIQHLLEQHGFNAEVCARLIIGGPMMGYTMEHSQAPVIKTTNCVLVPSMSEMPDPDPQQACIRCGMCAEACPASLLPQQLYWFSRSEDFDRLHSHNLFDCIECGACSFVCPSNIPLVQYYRASKGAIRHHDEEKRKAEHSRKRFEFRQERIEQAEIEKEAKRQARKKAAEAAKAKLAETGSTQSNKTETTGKNINREKAPIDPVKARAKLERAVSSAQSRVERSIKALSSAEEDALDNSRIESLSARVKEAELKVAEAKNKLKAFDSDSNNSQNTSSDVTGSASAIAEQTIKNKLGATADEKLEKNIATLEKRIETAKQKVAEAEENGAATVDALKTGVAKLEKKLEIAKTELSQLDQSESKPVEASAPEKNAADAAIEKAKARAEAMATMSDEEKAAAQRESLIKRLEKARVRLAKAETDNDDNIDAFRTGVEKLEAKLESTKN